MEAAQLASRSSSRTFHPQFGLVAFLRESPTRRSCTSKNCQGQILAVWIFAAKLPNSDLNFVVEFWGGIFRPVFPKERGPKKFPPPPKKKAKFRKNSPRISAEAFSCKIGGKLFCLQLELFCLQLSFLACSPLRGLPEALSHCKQESSNRKL